MSIHFSLAHQALPLKEIGLAPGGALSTFWAPVYRTSIPDKKNTEPLNVITHNELNQYLNEKVINNTSV